MPLSAALGVLSWALVRAFQNRWLCWGLLPSLAAAVGFICSCTILETLLTFSFMDRYMVRYPSAPPAPGAPAEKKDATRRDLFTKLQQRISWWTQLRSSLYQVLGPLNVIGIAVNAYLLPLAGAVTPLDAPRTPEGYHPLSIFGVSGFVPIAHPVGKLLTQLDIRVATGVRSLLAAIDPTSASVGAEELSGLLPTFTTHVIQFFFMMLIADFFLYWGHRLQHDIEYAWKHFHSLHHQLSTPTPVGTAFIDNTDALLQAGLPLILTGLIVRPHPVTLWLYMAFHLTNNALNHSGLECWWINLIALKWLPMRSGNSHHDTHHRFSHYGKNAKNYAEMFWLWDYVFGTYSDGAMKLVKVG